MATRKQKHEAAMAKRADFLAKTKESGLRAQKELQDQIKVIAKVAVGDKVAKEARDFGRRIRIFENENCPASAASVRASWEKFLQGFSTSPRLYDLAQAAFAEATLIEKDEE